MPGERDLGRMLESIEIERRPGTFTYVTGEWPGLAAAAHATVIETEGITYVVPVEVAEAAGAPVDFIGAWLTITVWSSLEAVGLTAAFSRVLGDRGIACNVLAGYHHDHIVVPADRAEDAIAGLRSLAAGAGDSA